MRTTMIILLSGSMAAAATLTCPSPSYSDVTNTIAAASTGDTVVIPSGSATWTTNIVITKGLNLIGAGSARTLITSNRTIINPSSTFEEEHYIIVWKPSSPTSHPTFRLSRIGFSDLQGSETGAAGIFIKNYTTNLVTGIRIDHCAFTNSQQRAIMWYGQVYGVVDHCYFTSCGKACDVQGANDLSWDYLNYYSGTTNAVYIEDNVIDTPSTPHSGGNGNVYVARYNTYYYHINSGLFPWFDAHGNMGAGGDWGTMAAEIYGNIIHCDFNTGVGIFDHRGGIGLLFNNYVDIHSSCSTKAREEFDDSLNPTTNPEPQHVSSSYYWNNRQLTNLVEAFTQNTPGVAHPIVENQDFWQQHATPYTPGSGMGAGTSLPATCTTGDGYWLTTQATDSVPAGSVGTNPTNPIDGVLYHATAPNTWTVYYTPLSYPHPLVLLQDRFTVGNLTVRALSVAP